MCVRASECASWGMRWDGGGRRRWVSGVCGQGKVAFRRRCRRTEELREDTYKSESNFSSPVPVIQDVRLNVRKSLKTIKLVFHVLLQVKKKETKMSPCTHQSHRAFLSPLLYCLLHSHTLVWRLMLNIGQHYSYFKVISNYLAEFKLISPKMYNSILFPLKIYTIYRI